MNILDKASILNADDLKRVAVEIPEWGGTVYIRVVTASELDKFEADSMEQRGSNVVNNFTNMRARFAAMVLCDEAGKRLFNDSEVLELGSKAGSALDIIFREGMKLNKRNKNDVDALVKK